MCTCAVRPAFSQSVIIHHSYLLHSLQCAPEQLIQCSILKITVLFYIPFYIHKKNMCLNLFPQHFCHPGLKLHCEDRPLKEWCSSPREMQCRVVVKRESSIASVEKGWRSGGWRCWGIWWGCWEISVAGTVVVGARRCVRTIRVQTDKRSVRMKPPPPPPILYSPPISTQLPSVIFVLSSFTTHPISSKIPFLPLTTLASFKRCFSGLTLNWISCFNLASQMF